MSTYHPGSSFRERSRSFGRQKHPITGKVTGHAGDDWPAPAGTPIPAAYDGTVVQVAFQYNKEKGTGWGWYVLLEHQINGKKVHTRYAHMREESPLKVGDRTVKKGDPVGLVGSTGGSTGNHLHFEVIVDGTPVKPDSFDFGGEAQTHNDKGPWSYPFDAIDKKRATNRGLYLGVSGSAAGAMSRVQDGYYPIGGNGLWHGGIHFDAGSGTILDQPSGVHCIADGEVVAYQINRKYPEIEFNPGKKRAAYSTGFTLVRHRLELPKEPPRDPKSAAAGTSAGKVKASAGSKTPPAVAQGVEREKLVFYSLYMHQLDWEGYQRLDSKDRPWPAYWGSEPKRFRVGDRARDPQDLPPEPELIEIRLPALKLDIGEELAESGGTCGDWHELDPEAMC